MRRFALLLIVIALLSLSGVVAQDDGPGTIYDLLVADDDFSQFVAMLDAHETLSERLATPNASLTVFAPSNAAVEGTLAAADIPLDALLDDAEALDATLAHHVIPVGYRYEDLLANDLTYMPTVLAERALAIQVVNDDVAYINGVRSEFLSDAANGTLIAVDEVLIPPQRLFTPDEMPERSELTIAEHLQAIYEAPASAQLFYELLLLPDDAALDLLDSDGPFTLLMPSDFYLVEYFDTLLAEDGIAPQTFAQENPERFRRLVGAHIMPGEVSPGTIRTLIPLLRGETFKLINAAGSSVVVDQNAEDFITFDGIASRSLAGYFSNGVIYILDGVIEQDAVEALPEG